MKKQILFGLVLATTMLFACQEEKVTTQEESVATPSSAKAATFAKGADFGYLTEEEKSGQKWYESNGTQKDCIDLLKARGIESTRIRTFVNPGTSPSHQMSRYQAADFAVRCKNKGLRIMVDFMFGDSFNSVGKQNPPAAWAGKTYTETLKLMRDYVANVMNIFKTKGVTPEWVQIGNEINLGICLPVGGVGKGAQMAGLLNAAHDEVKRVFPNCKVIIHVAGPQNASCQTLLDTYKNNGGKWDICGFSSYASKADQPSVQNKAVALGNRYGKPIMMVEVGGKWNKAADTKAVITQWINGMKANNGQGVFYWEPEVSPPFSTYEMGALDINTHKFTVALDAFK